MDGQFFYMNSIECGVKKKVLVAEKIGTSQENLEVDKISLILNHVIAAH